MNTSEVSLYIIIAMLSMALSMAIIPVMIRLAPKIGMIDTPDPRKVHKQPIPRVGGLGIVIGALVPMLIWLPYTDLPLAFLAGVIVLLVFGTWDDVAELGVIAHDGLSSSSLGPRPRTWQGRYYTLVCEARTGAPDTMRFPELAGGLLITNSHALHDEPRLVGVP